MPEFYSFKNWMACLKGSQAHTLNKVCVIFCSVVRNLIFLRNLFITNLYSLLFRPSCAELRDFSLMKKTNQTYKTMLSLLISKPLIWHYLDFSFFTYDPCLVGVYCHTLLRISHGHWASIFLWTFYLTSTSWFGHRLRPLYDCRMPVCFSLLFLVYFLILIFVLTSFLISL